MAALIGARVAAVVWGVGRAVVVANNLAFVNNISCVKLVFVDNIVFIYDVVDVFDNVAVAINLLCTRAGKDLFCYVAARWATIFAIAVHNILLQI
jgi:hypothetical protein